MGHPELEQKDDWSLTDESYATHGIRSAFEADRLRDAELRRLGYEVLRFTSRQPQAVAATLRAALAPG